MQKQEKNDPKFEEKLAADDRRAKANRQAAGMEAGAATGQVPNQIAVKDMATKVSEEPPSFITLLTTFHKHCTSQFDHR